MNTYLRTLPLPGAVRPVREHGASALDRAVTAWPAPDPAARVLDSRSTPTGAAAARSELASWPAPDPVMRFDLPAPQLRRAVAPVDGRIPWTDLVEPRYTVPVPDLQSASRAAIAPPTEVSYRQVWPAPTLADAAPVASAAPVRSRTSNRLLVGLAAASGALAVGAAAFVTLF